jgi:hypothetical protein
MKKGQWNALVRTGFLTDPEQGDKIGALSKPDSGNMLRRNLLFETRYLPYAPGYPPLETGAHQEYNRVDQPETM